MLLKTGIEATLHKNVQDEGQPRMDRWTITNDSEQHILNFVVTEPINTTDYKTLASEVYVGLMTRLNWPIGDEVK